MSLRGLPFGRSNLPMIKIASVALLLRNDTIHVSCNDIVEDSGGCHFYRRLFKRTLENHQPLRGQTGGAFTYSAFCAGERRAYLVGIGTRSCRIFRDPRDPRSSSRFVLSFIPPNPKRQMPLFRVPDNVVRIVRG